MRKKLFGTDGVRGRVNNFPIDSLSLVKLAYAIATYFDQGQKLKCLIGKDTRVSGYMIETAIVSGLLSKNVDITFLGPVPSPAVAMLTPALNADFGIMISASHNPYHDNGIKIFDKNGEKLNDEAQQFIEESFDNNRFTDPDEIGKATRLEDCSGRYIEFVKRTLKEGVNFKNMKIVLDCAHGSGYKFGPKILEELGAEVISISNTPDGVNINEKCGATYLKTLSQAVVHYQADIGLALDGDADRLAVVDEKGYEVKGEYVFACLASWLNIDRCVVTQVTNPGLIQYLSDRQIEVFVSDVGDLEVFNLMKKEGCRLGGEPSGHFILNDFLNSSDGMIAALQVLSYLSTHQKRPSALKNMFQLMNSFEKNIPITKNFTNHEINEYVKDHMIKNPFLIRKSGTEPALRLHMWGIGSLIAESERLVEVVEGFLKI